MDPNSVKRKAENLEENSFSNLSPCTKKQTLHLNRPYRRGPRSKFFIRFS